MGRRKSFLASLMLSSFLATAASAESLKIGVLNDQSGVQADFAIRGASFGQALVLVNGARLNDAQSGHHNGDIPVSLSG